MFNFLIVFTALQPGTSQQPPTSCGYSIAPVPEWRQQPWPHESPSTPGTPSSSYQWGGYSHHHISFQQPSPPGIQLPNLVSSEGAHPSFLHRYPHEVGNFQEVPPQGYCQTRVSPNIPPGEILTPSYDENRIAESPEHKPSEGSTTANGSPVTSQPAEYGHTSPSVPAPGQSPHTMTHANMYFLPQVSESYDASQEESSRVKGETYQEVGNYSNHSPSSNWPPVSPPCI